MQFQNSFIVKLAIFNFILVVSNIHVFYILLMIFDNFKKLSPMIDLLWSQRFGFFTVFFFFLRRNNHFYLQFYLSTLWGPMLCFLVLWKEDNFNWLFAFRGWQTNVYFSEFLKIMHLIHNLENYASAYSASESS